VTHEERRVSAIVRRAIAELSLDLRGLTVFTEAASGAYAYTPIIAAVAGASRVVAVTTDSRYGSKESIARETGRLASLFEVADIVDVVFEKTPGDVGGSDIVTNSGWVRPIDRRMVGWMKPTAVVPLMWETWELRPADIDLEACRAKGILVLGTREDQLPHSMYPYCGFAAMKLLFEMGLEGYRTRVILIGGGILGRAVRAHFVGDHIDVVWFAADGGEARPLGELRAFWHSEGPAFDAIIVAEQVVDEVLIGAGGLIDVGEVVSAAPHARIGVIAGVVDDAALREAGILVAPAVVRPFGYMSYQPDQLGPRPVLELYAAGLRVGQAMATARLRGRSLEEATSFALRTSPAMAFDRMSC
jgi:hypothetical protein